ncbi:hypothetical protein GCM10010172_67860 [Paractinoplanes ferrugineus]|uniref:Uncharacterized protein n=1 Tax=Paractinoplanes ferrugineus TaxID=113564 RepID=A0A919ML83_9ACTN|nr:hypothetical protein [Actinoplanes ferrugineus]GIE16560.1 hypothetical protein Afe05nite_84000 [Actinoplanes ferrugineus]
MTTPIERRYRRLLLAYPRYYREHRGAEILTTVLEMAEDGHRPGPHLVLAGLRQRFKLPARSPLAWVAALLAAAVLGGFGAAAGTWIAWRTAAAVPSDQQVQALNAALTGMPGEAPLFPETSGQQGPSVLVLTDGAREWSAARVRDALTGAGWRIASFRESEARTQPREDTNASFPTTFGYWAATSGGLRMNGSAEVIAGKPFEDGGYYAATYRLTVWPVEPAVLRPLTVAGIVAGLLAGWLLVAALARRRLATALAAVGLAVATAPAYRFYREAHDVLVYERGAPYPVTVDGSHGGTLTLICTVAGVLAVVAAVLAARDRQALQPGWPGPVGPGQLRPGGSGRPGGA